MKKELKFGFILWFSLNNKTSAKQKQHFENLIFKWISFLFSSSSPYKSNTKKPNYEFGEFNVIKMLIAQLPDGLIVKHQVST